MPYDIVSIVAPKPFGLALLAKFGRKLKLNGASSVKI